VNDIRENLRCDESLKATKRLQLLVERGSLGLHLTRPFHVVLAGRPNVGKSSLINALVGFQRAIVFDQPGTTRDVVTVETAIDGWPVALSDTAGLCASEDPIEQAGVERARARLKNCELVVLAFDASNPRSTDDERLEAEFSTALVVETKCDLARSLGPAVAGSPIRTSAVTGGGIGELLAAVSRRLVPRTPAPGEAVPFSEAQIESLRNALVALERRDVQLAAEVLSQLATGVHGSRA
jgi:tRNA modification GTPase